MRINQCELPNETQWGPPNENYLLAGKSIASMSLDSIAGEKQVETGEIREELK